MLENMRASSTKHRDTLWRWNTLRWRPRHYTLDFYTKVQMWGRMVCLTTKFHTHQRLSWLKRKMISALPCYKKKREKRIYEKRRKKRREKRSRLAPHGQHKKNTHQRAAWLHQEFSSPIPLLFTTKAHTHSLCVGLSLGTNLRWTFYNQAVVAASPKFPSMNAAGNNTQACKSK
jgi:hypothetical protein